MDRLTHYDREGHLYASRGYEVALARLANYEDTGLYPEEVRELHDDAIALYQGKEGNRVTYPERKAIYETALQVYGMEAQTMMAIEEMSELTKELCKLRRGKWDMEALADEIADVTIMLEQLRLMYDLNAAVCRHMDAKVLRLQGKVRAELKEWGL